MKTLRYILHVALFTATVTLLCFRFSAAQNSFPTPTGPVELDQTGAAAGSGGELRLLELNANGNNFVGLKAPDNIPANVTWTLPDADGGNGNVLSTNGSGTLSFVKRVNTDLSNLKTTTAINASLVPAVSNSIDLGSTSIAWRHGYFLSSVGIGTTFPDNTLHVFKGSAGVVTGNTNAPLVVENSTNCYLNLLAPDANERGILFGDPVNNSDGGIIYSGAASVNGLQFRTNGNTTRMTISSNGEVGIGTTSPTTKLQIIGGGDVSLTGLGFIQLGPTTSGNVVFDDNEIEARSNGLASTLFLQNDAGNLNVSAGGLFVDGTNTRVGINTTGPAVECHLFHGVGSGSTHGLRLENNGGNGNDWTFYVENSTADLEIYFGGVFKGGFSDVDGSYSPVSDMRLKKDVEEAPQVLDKVMKVDVKKYHFLKNQPGDMKYYGMIAQEVEPLFPELVQHNIHDDGSDVYTMNYSAWGVIAIKAIQEQQAVIASQEQTISDMKQQLDAQQIQTARLTEQLTALEAAVSQPVSTDGIARFSMATENAQPVLGQNVPNPFDNSTLIPFRLPKNCKDASLRITEATTGSILRIIPLVCGETQISIDAGQLASGQYTYSLYVDGNLIDTRQMTLTR